MLALVVLILLALLAGGCVRVKTDLTISPDDTVSGQIIAASKPRNNDDAGPQFNGALPFAQKVAISEYKKDGFVGSSAVFSNLTFSEVPQLANMNADSAGVDLSLRRAGDQVILEGRADLTLLTDPSADVSLTVAFPGEVTATNGKQVDPQTVQWQLRPGIVSTMSAQARYTDPSARSFTGAATWLGFASFLVAAVIALLAWLSRDRSPTPAGPRDRNR